MHAAIVSEWGKPPKYVTVPNPDNTSGGSVEVIVDAVGVHNVVRSRATGKHYSSGPLPHLVGVDGVGRLASTNEPVYFASLRGSFAERVYVQPGSFAKLPVGADPLQVAAFANPTMSAWMSLARRVRAADLPKEWAVVVMGATSASGRAAVEVARARGAARVVGVARSAEGLASVDGLDETIVLDAEDASRTDFSSLVGRVDVVLDYLSGPPAGALLATLGRGRGRTVQYVQIGGLAGEVLPVPTAALRSCKLSVVGSGPGSWLMEELLEELDGLVTAVSRLARRPIRIEKLSAIESVWDEEKDSSERL
ncbi:hypothetical protein HK405_001956, partial [Cladochytrium tenue]